MMTPIKCVQTAVTSGWVPVKVEGHSWFAVKVEHVHALGSQTTWALVPDEASTCNPSEADIARRVELLQESCSTSIIVSYGIRDNEYGAIVAGKCYIVTTQLRHHNVFGDDHPTAVWTEASPEVFAAELRRVAIRQLLAERGAK